jgi:hypothetical protein
MSAWTVIGHVEVPSGGQAIIDFTSISSSYTDLVILGSLRSETNDDFIDMRFNNSSSSFTSKFVLGNGATASTNTRADQYQSATTVPNNWTGSTFGNFQIYIPNYAGSTNKSFSIDTVTEQNSTTAYSEIIAGLWSNTDAINQITFRIGASSGDAAQYSSITLYGITKGSSGGVTVS